MALAWLPPSTMPHAVDKLNGDRSQEEWHDAYLQDLNRAIQREHYPLPTIEDIATRLHGAKVFSVLDVRKGFWHIELDEPSSYLTTFHTPFGRYRWKRMPFGISSAPEVFQRRMHELIEGLQGVEVIADDRRVWEDT